MKEASDESRSTLVLLDVGTKQRPAEHKQELCVQSR